MFCIWSIFHRVRVNYHPHECRTMHFSFISKHFLSFALHAKTLLFHAHLRKTTKHSENTLTSFFFFFFFFFLLMMIHFASHSILHRFLTSFFFFLLMMIHFASHSIIHRFFNIIIVILRSVITFFRPGKSR